MYIVIERSANSILQTEYHIINEIQMKQFIIDNDCHETVSHKDFANNAFGENLETALNESNEDKQYQVLHCWLN